MKYVIDQYAEKYKRLENKINLLKNKINESEELVPSDIKRLSCLEKQYLRKPVELNFPDELCKL